MHNLIYESSCWIQISAALVITNGNCYCFHPQLWIIIHILKYLEIFKCALTHNHNGMESRMIKSININTPISHSSHLSQWWELQMQWLIWEAGEEWNYVCATILHCATSYFKGWFGNTHFICLISEFAGIMA